jgi:hypothetical protein
VGSSPTQGTDQPDHVGARRHDVRVYDRTVREQASRLLDAGLSLNATSKRLGVSRAAVRDWRDNPGRKRLSDCPVCVPDSTIDQPAYAHLLGLYLGDGCISLLQRQIYSLRIACDQRYPRLIAEAGGALASMRPGTKIYAVPAPGCVHVKSYWKHWPCLFPQHGPGRKHERPIELADWQRHIVQEHPGRFLRGLFHSDGCRFTNWTERVVAGQPKRYEYPRYMFSNKSTDIIGLCTWALDLLEISWRMCRPDLVSVARRDAVAALDVHVGPKA